MHTPPHDPRACENSVPCFDCAAPDTHRPPFEAWEAENRAGLMRDYRDYLRHALDDEGFDITMTEDYWT